ncbi:LOW QUALITY PROTEIN: headcase protein homolog [Amphiura filiformis]|uniref:LOW QUALITY PROTEIN: headcase protein homolog n=1 Tax=Amphiura filiformis TaxID=82378 RepID=UPI003B20F1B2
MPYSKEEKARKKAEQFREQEHVQAEEVNNNDPNGAVGVRPCCVPTGCLEGGKLINIQNPDDVDKVVCNNPDCPNSSYMHKICFQTWEEEMLGFLRSCGRLASWSEKQRRQNLWTKKGYDLAWKACSCTCGKGHLRKDLDWIPPLKSLDNHGAGDGGGRGQKKRRKKSNDKPTIGRATSLPSASNRDGNGRHRHTSAPSTETHDTPPQSPVSRNFSPGQSLVVMDLLQAQTQIQESGGFERTKHPSGNNNSRSSSGNRSSSGSFSSGASYDPGHSGSPRNCGSGFGQSQPPIHPGAINKGQPTGPNGYNSNAFLHRMDLSAFFQVLPQTKLNPYHIKMEDDSHVESDDIRPFLFSVLNSQSLTSVSCSLCQFRLAVFDRYPLIDGTFYLSPIRHSDGSIRVVIDGRPQYLGAVCMKCLEGVQHIVCRICNSRWDGSHHQLGTLYSYDIFAASPCCPGRVSCKKCGKPVMDPTHGTHFFSDYSQNIRCPHCGVPDFHFIKPLSSYEVHLREVGVR